MLVLTRRTGEAIQLGEDITIKLISISRKQARVAIQAPNEIRIRRCELSMAHGQDAKGTNRRNLGCEKAPNA